MNFESVIVEGSSHASYYPGSTSINLKVIYDKQSRRIIGAQAVGQNEGVDKRLDVISTAMAGKLTVDDLGHLDLAYAPPFGSARDVINTAGFAGRNNALGLINKVSVLNSANDALAPLVIDVRDELSHSVSPVPPKFLGGCDSADLINIPLEKIRGRLGDIIELTKSGRSVITVCNRGKLSYFASRILSDHGIKVESLSGGLTMLRNRYLDASAIVPTAVAKDEPGLLPRVHKSDVSKAVQVIESTEKLDVCGIACPGPIMAIRKRLPSLRPGSSLIVTASDEGFLNDFPAFCRMNNLEVVSVSKKSGLVTGILKVPGVQSNDRPQDFSDKQSDSKRKEGDVPVPIANNTNDVAIVVFSGELDKVLAAFVIANGAVAMGGKVTMFFTFWGLNALKKSSDNVSKPGDAAVLSHSHKALMDEMLNLMLPKDANHLPLSHLNFGGFGQILMKNQMKSKHLPNLPDLMASAIASEKVRIVGCTMSMDAFGINKSELISSTELGGVADFLEAAARAKTTLFI